MVRLGLRAAAAAHAAAVLVLSLLPGDAAPDVSGFGHAAHAAAYALLAFLLRTGWPELSPWLVLAGAAAYGGLLEFVQLFVPGRAFEWMDVAANAVGAAAGVLAGGRFGTRANPTRS